jgi:hypothetical protein
MIVLLAAMGKHGSRNQHVQVNGYSPTTSTLLLSLVAVVAANVAHRFRSWRAAEYPCALGQEIARSPAHNERVAAVHDAIDVHITPEVHGVSRLSGATTGLDCVTAIDGAVAVCVTREEAE